MRLAPSLFFESRLGLLTAFVVVGLSVSSCARQTPKAASATAVKAPPVAVAPPPLALVPAEVARTTLVASFVLPSLERSLANGVALVKQAAPLPLDAAGVRDMLLAQAGLPPEMARHLDIGAPMGGASVVGSQPGAPLTAFSFVARTPADVTALLTALGRTVGRRGQAIQIENAAGDRGWFLAMGNLVVFADTDEALVRAGSLAIEARRSTKDDLSVTIYPDMVARAAGTGMQAALSRFNLELEERAAAGGNKLGPEARRQMGVLVNYLADITAAELVLDIDPVRGVSLLARVLPKAGSKLEAVARVSDSVEIDRMLLGALLPASLPAAKPTRAPGGGDAGAVVTSAYGRATLDQFARVRGKLPSGKGKSVVAAGNLLDAVVEGLTGQFSMVGRVQPALSWEMVFPARDAASATRIQAALLAADKDAMATVARAATQGEGMELKVLKARREAVGKGKGKDLHVTLASLVPPTVDPAVRHLLGAGPTDAFLAVAGDRLVITVGQGAKARMAAAAAAGATPKLATKVGDAKSVQAPAAAVAPAPPQTAVGEALASTGGRSFFYFLDLRQVIALVGAAGGNSRLRTLTGNMHAPLPVLGGTKGDPQGQQLTLDFTIPASCFAGMGALIQAALMAGS